MVTVYGIKNCDTMKKARRWLESKKIAYRFHDYKAAGIDKAVLEVWVKKVGWKVLFNRAGTTFRKLSDADKEDMTERKAVALMLAQPSLIKRGHDHGDGVSTRRLADLNFSGAETLKKDPAAAQQLYLEAAQIGDSEAMYRVSSFIVFSLGHGDRVLRGGDAEARPDSPSRQARCSPTHSSSFRRRRADWRARGFSRPS